MQAPTTATTLGGAGGAHRGGRPFEHPGQKSAPAGVHRPEDALGAGEADERTVGGEDRQRRSWARRHERVRLCVQRRSRPGSGSRHGRRAPGSASAMARATSAWRRASRTSIRQLRARAHVTVDRTAQHDDRGRARDRQPPSGGRTGRRSRRRGRDRRRPTSKTSRPLWAVCRGAAPARSRSSASPASSA